MSGGMENEQRWREARRRAEILARLSDRPGEAEVQSAIGELGISRATLFRWLKRFRQDDRTSTLLPRRRGPNSGMQPLNSAVLTLVEGHFEKLYATRRKPTLTRFQREVAADCRAAGLQPPSIRRLGRWLEAKDQGDLMRRREGAGKSEPVFLAMPGGLDAPAPLDIVQIDHTKVDVTVVDPVTRLPIGRPTLTLAIDVNTRMAMGFYLSLEAPSLTAVALCLTHCVVDKTAWLAARGIASGMADARNSQGHPCRQRSGIPRARLRARLRRTSDRSRLPSAWHTALWWPHRKVDRDDDGGGASHPGVPLLEHP